MYTGKTVFAQLMKFIPEYEFQKCVDHYNGDYRIRKFSCREHFLVMSSVQLTGRESLRDIEPCLSALSIAEFYRERWKIELFLKWIKQHLHIKTFYGTSQNAVCCQIRIAICAYLLIAVAKKKLDLAISLYTFAQTLGLTLFVKTPIKELFNDKNLIKNLSDENQLLLWNF